jgi:hypothetical protein
MGCSCLMLTSTERPDPLIRTAGRDLPQRTGHGVRHDNFARLV